MAKFRQPPYSVAEANIISKSITANGTYNASSDNADGYNPVTVNVPESVIVSKSITANGTYNASSDNADGYNPVTVSVPAPVMLSGTSDPTTIQGNDGDTYIKYILGIPVALKTSIIGGYNGGAPLKCYIDNNLVLSATGTTPYNLDYDVKTASYTVGDHTISIVVTPPANSTSALVITWSIDNIVVWTESIMPDGANTSYGYNTEEVHTETIADDDKFINAIYYKQSSAWLSVGDAIVI